jgi:predicted kinase
MGVAGSGKTTLAKEILRRVWALYLDNNHIVDAFFPETRKGAIYEKWRPHFYQALYSIVYENLKIGNSVVLDVPHVKEMQDRKWRGFMKGLVAGTRSRIVVIRCFCSDSVLRSRLRLRDEKRDRWKLTHWQEFLRQQPIRLPLSFPHLDIDTQADLTANVKAAVRYILRTGIEPAN